MRGRKIPAMNCSKPVPSAEDLLRAEKQVLAGIYGRLYARYAADNEDKFASLLALAVARTLLSIPSEDGQMKLFTEQNRDRIDKEIPLLKDDTDIRRMITDTLVMRIVFLHKKRGCSSTETLGFIENLKQLGIYLEGSKPPTPGTFVRSAGRFFAETQLRQPAPPSKS